MQHNRRTFVKNAALIPAALAAGTTLLPTPATPARAAKVPQKLTVLFQGDSITDAGRDKESTAPNDYGKMGLGYATLTSAMLLNAYPKVELTAYNRGISGNKVYQLDERWEADALELKPDVLSILIGVNDYWHMFNGNYDGTVEVYDTDYRKLLDRTRTALPDVKFILMEPFMVMGGKAVSDPRWAAEFPAYQQAAKQISDDYGTAWVPLQKVFDEALKKAPAEHWSGDGVHPSLAGSYLMAEAWMKAFAKLY